MNEVLALGIHGIATVLLVTSCLGIIRMILDMCQHLQHTAIQLVGIIFVSKKKQGGIKKKGDKEEKKIPVNCAIFVSLEYHEWKLRTL